MQLPESHCRKICIWASCTSRERHYGGEKLSRLATIYILVLKLIYDEQMAAVSSSSHIVTTLGAVNGKAGEFHVLSGLPSPTEMRRTVAFLKKYQIVEPVDVMEELDENSRLVLSVHQYSAAWR